MECISGLLWLLGLGEERFSSKPMRTAASPAFLLISTGA